MQLDSRGVEGRIKWRARLWRIRRSRPSSVAASKQTQNVITRQPCYVVELCLRTVYVYLAPDLTVTHFLLAGGPQLSLSVARDLYIRLYVRRGPGHCVLFFPGSTEHAGLIRTASVKPHAAHCISILGPAANDMAA